MNVDNNENLTSDDIAMMLAKHEEAQENPQTETPETETEEVETKDAQETPEQEPMETEETEDEDQEGSDESEEESEEEVDDTDDEHILEFKGKKYTETDLETALKSDMLQSDYTKKMQEIATQRADLETEKQGLQGQLQQAVQEQQQAYLNAIDELNKIKQAWIPDLSQAQLQQLAATNPEQYQKHIALTDALERGMQDVNSIFAQDNKLQDQQVQEYANQQTEILMQNTEWKDFQPKYEGFVKGLVDNGIAQDVAVNILDANMVQLLDDGLKWRNSKANVESKTKEVKNGLKVLKKSKKAKTTKPKEPTQAEKLAKLNPQDTQQLADAFAQMGF